MKDFRFLNKIPQRVYFVYFPLFLLAFLLFLFVINFLLQSLITEQTVLSTPFKLSSQAKLPIIKTEFIPVISATGAIIMDADSKVVLYSKNSDLRFSTASTTKIMTALVALDYFKSSDILIVKEATSDGSVLGLLQGEQMTFENLLYAMLLPSANDAALAIAQNYPGGEQAFLLKMNEKAKLFQLFNTHYEDPAGLEDSGDYTTPFDLARLSSFAMQNPEFRKIVGTKEKIIYNTSFSNIYNLQNLNILLGTDGVNGIKTGFTKEAGQVLVTSKNEQGKTIILVVMGSVDRFEDTAKLLDLVSNNLSFVSIHP